MNNNNNSIIEAADQAILWLNSISDDELIAELEKHCDGPLAYAFDILIMGSLCKKTISSFKYLVDDSSLMREAVYIDSQICQNYIWDQSILAANDDRYISYTLAA